MLKCHFVLESFKKSGMTEMFEGVTAFQGTAYECVFTCSDMHTAMCMCGKRVCGKCVCVPVCMKLYFQSII